MYYKQWDATTKGWDILFHEYNHKDGKHIGTVKISTVYEEKDADDVIKILNKNYEERIFNRQ